MEITSAVPPVFAAYCTLVLPEGEEGARIRHDRAVVAVLERASRPQPWWLGYLEYGTGAETIFYEVARVQLYASWSYVVVLAGPEQALTWRESEGRWSWKGALPDLISPADHSWLLSALWDEEWSCIGGPEP